MMLGSPRLHRAPCQVPGTPLFPAPTCNATCAPLAADEWLANVDFWTEASGQLVAKQNTVLKKSIANSQVLPGSELKSVSAGALCAVVSETLFRGYKLCRAA